LKVGNLSLDKRAILSPMAEVTDAPLRQICREYGAGLTFTQMVSAKGIIDNSFTSLKALAFRRDEKPIGVQLITNEPEYLEKAIKEIKSFQPDLIDLNCGCSVPQVCKYGLGAAILDDPVLLAELVRTMTDAAGDIPVSIKLRLGRDKNNITVLRNAKIAEENGTSLITIHARTRNQSYAEKPDWQWIKKVKEVVNIPVVGNGNLFYPEDCIRMINETGCDFVFVARGALGNPFIFNRLNSILESGVDPGVPDLDEVGQTVLKHFNLILKEYGEDQGIKKARKHLIWYFRFYKGIYNFIEKIYSIDEHYSVENFILEHIQKIKENYYPEEDLEKVNKSFNEHVLFWMSKGQIVETYN
jgi:tRNA-dihydrouridine synthase B